MTELDTAMEAVTLGATAAALVVFVLRTGARRQPGPESETDFGVVFSAFLAAWLATEVFEIVAPASLQEAGAFAHLLLLVTVALWLNARFRTALRHAREDA